MGVLRDKVERIEEANRRDGHEVPSAALLCVRYPEARALVDLIDARGAVIDAEHLTRQREWSTRNFGPHRRTEGVLKHIAKEMDEVRADPAGLEEWVDIVILALDGAWRAGHEPQAIIDGVIAKQEENFTRSYPDWRTVDAEGEPIEHIREVAGRMSEHAGSAENDAGLAPCICHGENRPHAPHLPCDMGCQPDWHHGDCAIYVKVTRDIPPGDGRTGGAP